jgi:hypothetical protein
MRMRPLHGLMALSAFAGCMVVAACEDDATSTPYHHATDGSGAAAGLGGGAGSAGTQSLDGAVGGSGAAAGSGTGGSAGTAGDGAGGGAGTGGGSGSAGTGSVDPKKLSATCSGNQDCGGLICLTPASTDFWGGGPGNGYCTMDCTASAKNPSIPDPCVALGGLCLIASLGSDPLKGYCAQSCTEGPAVESSTFGQFDPNKCHGRKDLVCQGWVDSNGKPTGSVCTPNCTKDSDCGSTGKKCDPFNTVCVSNPQQGSPLGSNCTQWAQSQGDAGAACAGNCLAFIKTSDASASDPNNIAHFCTQTCVYGDVDSCGFKQSPPAGLCLLSTSEAGNGDLAFCAQLCDVDADCLDHDDNAWCDTSTVSNLGRGLCDFRYGHGS